MTDEEKLSKIHEGRHAVAVSQFLTPILERIEHSAIARLKNLYRDGQSDSMRMHSTVGELSVLDDIRNALSAKVRQSETLSKED